MGRREFYRWQECGSENEVACVSCYLGAGGEWFKAKGIEPKEVLRNLGF